MRRNHLAAETSPYLKQHADNPVDWYPWGEAALAAAARDNKPILLSIGYAACHWCHVMAHESFEDPDTAALMNRLFINIKVDREERPDLDKIYQAAQQLLTHGSGGWPLTMFLTPTQQPFFGGTYFPREPRHGMPAFGDILRRVADYHRDHAEEILAQAKQLRQALAALDTRGGLVAGSRVEAVTLDDGPLRTARISLKQSFDSRFGGFTRAPKFPHSGSLERCMRQWYATSAGPAPDLEALYMATLSLTRMAEGGLYDQLGGGFARYSTDDAWMIPHFEKMLYDNALLLAEYARAALATGEPLFTRVANQTADWLLRDMHDPLQAFYSSLDADSEGHEGKFYVWSRDEVRAQLDPGEYAAFAHRFGLNDEANFEGYWHLHARAPVDEGAAPLIESARLKLLAIRSRRIRPARDEKILTSWNALAIKAFCIAGRVLERPDLIDAAAAAVDFIHGSLWRDGRLLATCKDGSAHLPAYLDDYVFLADALLELLQSRWRSADLEFATQLIDVLLHQFEDRQAGGFYFTAGDHEPLIHRSKTFGDDALPAGNGVAVSVLCRFGCLLGEISYLDAAERTLMAAWPLLQQYPQAHMSLLNGLEDFLTSTQILIIRGPAETASLWSRQLGAVYAPRRMIFAIPADAGRLPPALAAKAATDGTVAYLCAGMTCSAPITDLATLSRELILRAQ
jgi:uncharacterized protein YyaL (SSP411 family)